MKKLSTLLICLFTINSIAQITYYSSREDLQANCSTTLVLEDFGGGPTASGNTGCSGDFSSLGNDCFSEGELQEGFVITSSDNSSDSPLVYTNVGFVSNPTPIVGTNQYEDFTILQFPNGNIDAVGLDLYGAPFASVMHVRIYNVSNELVDSLTITEGMPGPYFFGFIADEPIASIEFQAEGFSVEMIGMLAFGTCSSVGVDDVVETEFSLFPNPATNNFALKTTATILSINIMDAAGKVVYRSMPNRKMAFVDLSSIASGNYFIQVETTEETRMQKLVKL